MLCLKQLAHAIFLVFLCLMPALVMAQEDVARLIDVPNVEKDRSNHSMTKAIRKAISDKGHIVFSQEEMINAAAQAQLGDGYWRNSSDIAKVNRYARHDAVVRVVNQQKSVVINVYNAYTGEQIAELERRLKKKNVVSTADAKAIANAVSQVCADIVPIEYNQEITISVFSTPSGASVMRDGVAIGTTPFEYTTTEVPGASEQWVITYPEHEPATQLISLEKTFRYDVNLHAKVYEPDYIGKLGGGTGRPIFLVGFNVAPTIRKLSSTAKKGTPISYTAETFALYSFDVEFYPFPIGLDVDYLQGLGIIFNASFGFLDSKFEIVNASSDVECSQVGKASSDGRAAFVCETSFVRIRAGIIYKLLFQKKTNRLDPDGMALDIILGYQYANFDIQKNSLYNGHRYSGIDFGLRFSAPLGLKNLRAAAHFDVYGNFGQGDAQKTTKWGNSIDSSWGISAGINFIYDIWRGIYARVGYDFTLMKTNFAGNGTIGAEKAEPVGAESKDMYHEILIGLGYMLY